MKKKMFEPVLYILNFFSLKPHQPSSTLPPYFRFITNLKYRYIIMIPNSTISYTFFNLLASSLSLCSLRLFILLLLFIKYYFKSRINLFTI